VNGNLNDMSHTYWEAGMYHEWTKSNLTVTASCHSKRLTLSLTLLSILGAWWEVDLGEGAAVSRVVIYNRNDGDASHASAVSGRLSNSVVSLINFQGSTVKRYRIGDATNVPVFYINFDSYLANNPNLVHKVRVQLDGTNILNMREVQVFDTTSGYNRAFNKLASQSSTFTLHSDGSSPASSAVNGNLDDFSHTKNDAGNVP
jgi:hypothetical protein